MASAKVREYAIELDKVRHIRLDLNAMVEFQERSGLNILEDFNTDVLRNPKNVRMLTFCCLMHEDPDLNEKTVGEYMDLSSIRELAIILNEAVRNAYPQPEDLAEDDGNPSTQVSPLAIAEKLESP